ncbi:MAG: TlpA family protein disulfide reductase [Bacteroidetes bacterium]|nr:MAG: TlpA family protein disulfide reductase [Bacteroidota bacterium]
MLKTSFLSTLLTFTLFFQACSSESEQKPNDMVASNEYVLTAINNTQYIAKKEPNGFSVENTQGKIIIFDIFATWCPPCKAAASHLSSLQEKYKDKLVIIGVTIEDDISNEKLKEFREMYDAHYTLVNSKTNRRLVDDIADSLDVGDRFPIPLMAMYLDGEFITHYVGAIEEEFIESDIKRALGL